MIRVVHSAVTVTTCVSTISIPCNNNMCNTLTITVPVVAFTEVVASGGAAICTSITMTIAVVIAAMTITTAALPVTAIYNVPSYIGGPATSCNASCSTS